MKPLTNLSDAIDKGMLARVLSDPRSPQAMSAFRLVGSVSHSFPRISELCASIKSEGLGPVAKLLFADGLTGAERAQRLLHGRPLPTFSADALADPAWIAEMAPGPADRAGVQTLCQLLAFARPDGRQQILEGHVCSDLIGFHVESHADDLSDLAEQGGVHEALATLLLQGRCRQAARLIPGLVAQLQPPARMKAASSLLVVVANAAIVRGLFGLQRCAAWTEVVNSGGRFPRIVGQLLPVSSFLTGGVLVLADFCSRNAAALFDRIDTSGAARPARPAASVKALVRLGGEALRDRQHTPPEAMVRAAAQDARASIPRLASRLDTIRAQRLKNIQEARAACGEPPLRHLGNLDLVTCQMHGIRPTALLLAMAAALTVLVARRNTLPASARGHASLDPEAVVRRLLDPRISEDEMKGIRWGDAAKLMTFARMGAGLRPIPADDDDEEVSDPGRGDRRRPCAIVYLERVRDFLNNPHRDQADCELAHKTMGAWEAFSPLAGL